MSPDLIGLLEDQERPDPEQTARVLEEVTALMGVQAEEANEEFCEEEISEVIEKYGDATPEELWKLWNSWTGEWLASRPLSADRDVDADYWVQEQFVRVLVGQPREYGINYCVVIPPHIIEERREGEG